MKLSFRWYGDDDPVTLEKIRQIPGMVGIVTAIYDIPAGEAWPYEKIKELNDKVEAAGLTITAIESVPVPEAIKMGIEPRDRYIENYKETLRNLAKVGIEVVTYNFMPVFDWTRSELDLPGWDTSYTKDELNDLMTAYQEIDEEDLWDNLEYFLKEIIPVAEEENIKMAIHPDDPPWSIFGLPRVVVVKENLRRLLKLVDSPANGLDLCSGSLGVNPENDIPEIIREFGDRIHFAHVRNVKITGEESFEEAAHLSEKGSLDIYEIMKAYHDVGFEGPLRPDHGRMIWGETGKPGYGLYDRALGATYINGLWEAINKCSK